MINFEEFCKIIKSFDGNMTIGIHGIGKDRIDKNKSLSLDEIGNDIMRNGFELHGWGGLLNSIKMFGRVKELGKNDLRRLYDYVWQFGDNGEIVNVLFGFPEIITNSAGDEFYLGYYNQEEVVGYAKGQKEAGDDLPLNKLFDEMRLVPNNFVIGCLKAKQDSPNSELVVNKNFYWLRNNQSFYDDLFNALINAGIPNPIEFEKYKELYTKYNMDGGLALKQYQEYLNNTKNK